MIRAVLTLLFVSLGWLHALAEPPLCQGRNLLDELKARDANIHDKVMAEAAATPNGEAVFWKIEGKAGSPPSWLLGTAHLTDPRIATLSDAEMTALRGARVVALEVAEAVDQQRLAAAMMGQARLLVMPLGQSMWDLIPDADEAAIRANPNLPREQLASFSVLQPWVVAAALSVPRCEQARQTAGLPTLDMVVGSTATALGIPVEGLEKIEEQLGVFTSLPLDTQAKYLIAVARSGFHMTDYFETLIQLYERRQITALLPLSKYIDPAANDVEVMQFFERDLISKRNRLMHERAIKLIDGGNAFIAVGALHLPGNDGLVELLRRSGYQVTGVE